MKNTYLVVLGLVLLFSFVLMGNSHAGIEKYGKEISNRTATDIKDILANPKAFEGKMVTIEGKIDSECTTGCWFFVKVAKGNFNIYVDTGKSGFAIPQYRGKKILVEGKVVLRASGPMIQGQGVEFR